MQNEGRKGLKICLWILGVSDIVKLNKDEVKRELSSCIRGEKVPGI